MYVWTILKAQNFVTFTELVRMGYVNLTVDNEVRYVFQPQNLSMRTEITFDPPISGREVKLSKDKAVLNENDPFLNFCEVQVWGR